MMRPRPTAALSNDQGGARAKKRPSRGRAPSGTEPVPTGRSRNRRIRRSRNWFYFIAFAGPNAALILAFVYYPLIMNVRYSTLDWRLGASSARNVGLANYREFFTSSDGASVWRVTIVFALCTVIGSMVLGLLMALVLNRKLPGTTFTRTALFSPYVLSGVGIGLIWSFMFDPQLGILRYVFERFGSSSPQWFLHDDLTLFVAIVVYIWKNLGYCTVIFISGLQSIPQELVEAAAVDGAGKARTFFSVVFPLLSPTVFFLLVSMTLSSMQAFDVLKILKPTGEGVNTFVFEIYRQSFGVYQRAGYASAIAVVLFVTLALITAIQFRFVDRKVHYA